MRCPFTVQAKSVEATSKVNNKLPADKYLAILRTCADLMLDAHPESSNVVLTLLGVRAETATSKGHQ